MMMATPATPTSGHLLRCELQTKQGDGQPQHFFERKTNAGTGSDRHADYILHYDAEQDRQHHRIED
jgi:hypothetical protein